MKIIFMGTPEFAVASLDALVSHGCRIVGVVTAPDKPAGRGMKMQESAVKRYATEHGLHVLQPEKLKDPTFLDELKSLRADLQVVVAFRMLPEQVWNMPPQGTINLHGSLLPQYRGAAPINRAVMNGETETGVTTFKLQHAIDTGDILLSERLPIGPEETAGEVHDRMKEIGAALLVRTVDGLAAGTLKEIPQDSIPGQVKHAPKIFTEDCRIDWTHSAKSIHDQVRGLSPFPGAFTTLQDKTIKVFRSRYEKHPIHGAPGDMATDGKKWLRFSTADGYIYLLEVQVEGKKRMGIEEFLRGFRA
jgi:methionyl-tRNA formyltransferase